MENKYKNLIKNISFISIMIISIIKVYGQYTITGHIYYSDDNSCVTSGNVYILNYNADNETTSIYDSTIVNSDGSYALTTAEPDSILECTGWRNSYGNEDHVLTYYKSTIDWESATKIYPPDNPTGIDIYVQRIVPLPDNLTISGTITTLDSNQNEIPLAGAIVVAKHDTTFRSASVTDSSGNYTLDSVASGSFTILANKVGYSQDSSTVIAGGNSVVKNKIRLCRTNVIRKKQSHMEVQLRGFRLNQNYPNPFNPKTIISYHLPAISNVKLTIYDLLGKKVAELVNTKQFAGDYEVSWEPVNLSSGVYFYELKTDRVRDVKKMIFNK